MKLTVKMNGDGNLFDEGHFAKGNVTKFKKDLAARMTSRMKVQKLTLQESAEKIGCEVADIRDIRKSEVADFEIMELVRLARKLGFELKMDVTIPGYESRKLN
jgi:predicted XRE-type DNA-binding protein